MAIPGRAFLLDVRNTAGDAWVEIAGCRENTENSSHQPADSTSKTSGAHRDYAAGTGFIETRLSASGVFTAGDGWDRLKAIQLSRASGSFQLRYGDGTIGTGSAFVSTIERSSPYEGVQEFSLELMFSGGITVTDAP
ncbi:phage tail tube protein [Zavarzinia sp.]|uniref:phage tail tube protein n=1 Tax=Zavarzinia sp. TaxID=2027920 RepID=UPI003BB6AA8E